MKVEHLDQLRERRAQGVVHPRAQHQHSLAQTGAGQGSAYRRLDFLLALGTPIAVDDVFGDYGLDVLGNVLGITCARFLTALQRTAAIRTGFGPVFHALVYVRGNFPSASGMARFSPRLFLAARRSSRFLEDGLHARWRGRRLMRSGRFGCPLFGQHLGLGQQREYHGGFAQRKNSACLFFGKRRAQRNIVAQLRQCTLSVYNILYLYYTHNPYLVSSDG